MKLKLLNIIFALLLSQITLAQFKNAEEVQNYFWNDNENINYKVPEKWKNESAVVLFNYIHHDYHSYGKNFIHTYTIRKRIKLQDKAAVNEFSEFSFSKNFKTITRYLWNDKTKFYLGVKVIKSNGEELIIDVENDAVEVDNEYKIAIKNLEVGDVIDYYFYREKKNKRYGIYFFKAIETNLGDYYPILNYKLFFETENDFFVSFKSFNGAPELKKIENTKSRFRQYELTASNLEKNDFPRWYYPLVELPTYRFQVYFAANGKFENLTTAFLPKNEKIIKTDVSKEEILDLYDNRLKATGNLSAVYKYLKDKNYNSLQEKVTDVYLFMRHYYYTRFKEVMALRNEGSTYVWQYYPDKVIVLNNQTDFIKHFTAFLKRENIDYEIGLSQARHDGSIKDLLLEGNIYKFIKVNLNEPIYFQYLNNHENINQIHRNIEGADAYFLSSKKGFKLDHITEGTLPVSTFNDNINTENTLINIDDDFKKINIQIVNESLGYPKTKEQYDKMSFSDYAYNDYDKFNTKNFVENVKGKKNKIRYENSLNTIKSDYKKKRDERIKEKLKSTFDIDEVDDYSFKIIQNGRYNTKNEFIYEQNFSINSEKFIKKAGPNYILNIGKFVTNQIDLEEKEKERKENIYMPYARTFNYNITLNIPDGYKVSGIDKLIKSVENETGKFVSTANIEGNKLIISATKSYYHNFEKNENWPKMMAFINEAFQFTNEKILLKK